MQPIERLKRWKLSHGMRWARCHGSGECFFVDQRAALPVVEIALLFGKPRGVAFDESALDEPSRSSGGEHEQARKPELAGALLDLVQERLAVPLAAEIGVHRQCRELAGLCRGKSVQRGAADDHAIVLGDDETLDLHFEAFAPARDETAGVLEPRAARQ